MNRRALVLAATAGVVIAKESRVLPAESRPVAERDGSKVEFQSHIIDISDTSLEVLEAGHGPGPFVCTHPYFDATGPHPGGDLTQSLASIGKTLYICPRGTGRSAPESRPEKLTISQLVDDLEAIRRKLKIERWVPVGHSTGGFTALEFAVRHPDAISGLMLICTAPSYRFLENPASLYNPENSVHKTLASIQMETHGGEEWRRAWLAGIFIIRPPLIALRPSQKSRRRELRPSKMKS
jgi:pimeloyl-ACP methyl ester carboxylesterase